MCFVLKKNPTSSVQIFSFSFKESSCRYISVSLFHTVLLFFPKVGWS